MNNFILVFRRDYKTKNIQPSTGILQAHLKKWQLWFDDLLSEGCLAAPIQKIDVEGRIIRNDMEIYNGPYVELKESIGGFAFIRALEYEQAIAIAKSCPILDMAGNVEIRKQIKTLNNIDINILIYHQMNDFVLTLRNRKHLNPAVVHQLHIALLKWYDKLAAEGKLSKSVHSFDLEGRTLRHDDVIIVGPYAEINEVICNILVIKAHNYDDAIKLAKGCPILEAGGNVEIRMEI